MAKNPDITVFEHQSIKFDKGDIRLTKEQYDNLKSHYGEKGVPYFSLINNGVKFNEHVGVIQTGNTLIEVLPKADRYDEQNVWRDILIGMVHAVRFFNVTPTSESALKLKPNSLLELYFEMFISETERLVHQGLVKFYRKTEGNNNALKGSILFGRNLNQNLVHKERFYIRFTVYDRWHPLNRVLFKTIKLLRSINTHASLSSRLNNLLIAFEGMPDISADETFFRNLVFDRKTESYRKAVEIARLLLLNYHPDISRGQNHVLALMFDMNLLWEQFVYVSIKNNLEEGTIHSQSTKDFWQPEYGYRSKMKPDIVINKDEPGKTIVIDTKWKNLNGKNPSPEDLRQMYVYHQYYGAKRVALLYPGEDSEPLKGTYFPESDEELNEKECSLISVSSDKRIKKWQKHIHDRIIDWAKSNEN